MPQSPYTNPRRFYQQEAQLYYQDRYSESQYEQDSMQDNYVQSQTYWESLKRLSSADPPAQENYRYHAAQRMAAGEDVTNRTMQMAAGASEAIFKNYAVYEGLGTAAFTSLGLTGGIAAPLAATHMMGEAAQYAGVDQAFGQFSRINDLRLASEDFAASSMMEDPFSGRMSRDQGKAMNDIIEDYARYASAYSHQSISSDDLRKEVETLSRHNVLENVKNAEDFARKFSELKDGVKRMTEVLGKSFEEGAAVMGQLRNVNIDPAQSTELIDSIRRTGTQAGLDFDTAFNAGMQGAMTMQGTGLSPRAGIRVGANAAAASEMIYESGDMSERDLYNIGGKEGLRQSLMEMPTKLKEDPLMKAAVMSAYRGGGEVDIDQFTETMQSGDLFGALSDMPGSSEALGASASYGGMYSRIVEENPDLPAMGYMTNMMNMLSQTGQTLPTEGALMKTLSRMSGGRFSKEELSAVMSRARTYEQGRGRAATERYMTGLGRSSGAMNVEWMGGLGRAYRESDFHAEVTRAGQNLTDGMRNASYRLSESISDRWQRWTTGTTDLEIDPVYSDSFKSFGDQLRRSQGLSPRDREAGEGEAWVWESSMGNAADKTDYLGELRSEGLIDESEFTDVDMSMGTLNRSASFYRNELGLSDSVAQELGGRSVSAEELSRKGGLIVADRQGSDDLLSGEFFDLSEMGKKTLVRQETVASDESQQGDDAMFMREAIGSEATYEDLSEEQRAVYSDIKAAGIDRLYDTSGDLSDEADEMASSDQWGARRLRTMITDIAESNRGDLSREELIESVGVYAGDLRTNENLEHRIDEMRYSKNITGLSGASVQELKDERSRIAKTLFDAEGTDEYQEALDYVTQQAEQAGEDRLLEGGDKRDQAERIARFMVDRTGRVTYTSETDFWAQKLAGDKSALEFMNAGPGMAEGKRIQIENLEEVYSDNEEAREAFETFATMRAGKIKFGELTGAQRRDMQEAMATMREHSGDRFTMPEITSLVDTQLRRNTRAADRLIYSNDKIAAESDRSGGATKGGGTTSTEGGSDEEMKRMFEAQQQMNQAMFSEIEKLVRDEIDTNNKLIDAVRSNGNP